MSPHVAEGLTEGIVKAPEMGVAWVAGTHGPHKGPYEGGRSGSERREGTALPRVQVEEGPWRL